MPDTTQVNANTKGIAERTYEAIVIGSGISGGWAAKELCEKGLKTLVLERGRNIEHIKDYPTMNTPIWEFRHRGQITKILPSWQERLVDAIRPVRTLDVRSVSWFVYSPKS